MKAKQSKLLQSCSKTGLKKSSVYKASTLIPILVLFFLQPATLSSLDVTHTLFTHENSLSLRLNMVDFPANKVKDVFQKGETTQVKFEVRLFRESSGIWSFLGDELLGEHSNTYYGSYDPFYDLFRLRTDEDTFEFMIEENFFSAFRSYHTSFDLPASEAGQTYLRARITFTPRKLMPPLNVLGPFLLDSRETSGWVHISVVHSSDSQGGR